MIEEIEEWRPVVGYEGLFEISSFGRLKRLGSPYVLNGKTYYRKMKISVAKSSRPGGYYLDFGLTKDGKSMSFRVNRLVAIAFIPNPENKTQTNHKDGNKQNNRVSNLEWVTAKENMRHAFRTGLHIPLKGENVPSAKLKNEDVVRIRELWSEGGYKLREVGAMFGVGLTNIEQIVNNKSWRHLI